MDVPKRRLWPWAIGLLAFAAIAALFVVSASPDAPESVATERGELVETPDAGTEPGREAIYGALDRLYPTERDFRFGVGPQPGEDQPPLAEIVAYRASQPVPHWHYITYGLSELGEKESEDPEMSGFGVEYTLRLVDDSEEPPYWPMNLLRYLATVVSETREPPDPKHSMNLPEGMLDAVSPGVEGLGFLEDPDLGSIDTPNGRLTFVNVIPLAHREWWLVGAWDFDKYVEALRAQESDVLWRVGRPSVLEGEAGRAIEDRVRRDGSSQSVDFCGIEWRDGEILLDPVSREVLIKFLRYRVAYGRDATIMAGERSARFEPGLSWEMECSDNECQVRVPQGDATAFADSLEEAHDGSTLTRPGNARFRFNATIQDER